MDIRISCLFPYPIHQIRKWTLALLFIWPILIKGQQSNSGSWNILNFKYTIHPKWSIFAETQIRSLKFYNHFHYYEYKGGVNYKPSQAATLTLGAGSYQTYQEGGDFVSPKNNDEFRLWPQMTIQTNLGDVKMEQRGRWEARYTSNGYRNRYRYRLGFSYHLGTMSKKLDPFSIQCNNEIFFTNREPHFERNRFQISTLFKLNDYNTIQLGYLHQLDYKINDEIGRKFWVIGYAWEMLGFKNR
jgi:hypothetical protein